MSRNVLLTALILTLGFSLRSATAQIPAAFDCRADDGRCPELVIAGDPPFSLPGLGLSPFRGFADPSLRRDPKTGVLWLSYSWVSLFAAPGSVPGKPDLDVGVSIHLARSDDDGRSFQHVTNIWESEAEVDKGAAGYSGHEVSTISPTASGWAALELRYFNPRGHGNDFKPNSFRFELAEGEGPEKLATDHASRLGGPLTGEVWRPFSNLSQIAGVGLGCPVWTEPSLFFDQGVLYLLAQCKTPSNPARGFLGVFERQTDGWRWVGRLTSQLDASALGGNELTQAELSKSRDGSLLLVVTPNIVVGRDEHHLGCAVLTVASLNPPRLKQGVTGGPDIRARISSSDSAQNGPGACSYDPTSTSGILIVRRIFSQQRGVVFSIHATSVNP